MQMQVNHPAPAAEKIEGLAGVWPIGQFAISFIRTAQGGAPFRPAIHQNRHVGRPFRLGICVVKFGLSIVQIYILGMGSS
ncbi:hypothetical protein A3721_12885 [Sulfitobacter sp. HI0023]|nr:hypothetical protein A3721_12885 [Sulfitobacter sp. HI0023]